MPYIKQDRREAMGLDQPPRNEGELNYCLTWHLIFTDVEVLYVALKGEVEEYLSVRDESYALYNEVIGVLECCRREFVRRRGANTAQDLIREALLGEVMKGLYDGKVAPYEDTKIKENGDIYL